ncbi:MAG: calcium-binding protein [Myxococcales bacterium]|nr:calcium-binding protein [Myxococcales bacterium]
MKVDVTRQAVRVGWLVLALLVCILPEKARAACTLGTCDATYCEINCPTGSDLIVFGTLYKNSNPAGVGVCRFTTGGSFVDVTPTNMTSGDYRVRADGADAASGGNDTLRMARPSSPESCGTTYPGGDVWTIKGELPVNSTYLFWGDLGDDTIYLCDRSNPSATDCITDTNAGRADGRGGADYVYGSPANDTLYGSGETDHIYGWAGDDTLYGGDGRDYVYGGNDDDAITGGGGDYDEGYGEAGCDIVDGGAGTGDLCDCGATGHGIAWQYCETVQNCGGCY